MIYLDNAATTGVKPDSVIAAVNNALKNYCVNPGRSGHKLSLSAAEAIYKVRQKAARLFGCPMPENVVFTLNCTQSINFVLKGVLSPSDHILISNLEHNAVARPVFALNKNVNVQFDIFDAFTDDITAELKRKIKPNTKMIFCTHASNVCGKVLPLKEIGDFVRQNGLLFGVDAAQSAGIIPISMKEMNIDFLCVAAHKGLYAPMGIGLLLINNKISRTIIEGGTGTNSIDLIQPEEAPERFESGTVNLPAIFGVGAGIDFVQKRGISKIFAHEKMLCDRLCSHLSKTENIKLYRFDEQSAPVVSLNIENVSSDVTAEILSKRGFAVRAGLHCAPIAHKTLETLTTGTVRISPSVFNKNYEIDKIIAVLSQTAKLYVN